MMDDRFSKDRNRDRAWTSLNPPGTRYGAGGAAMQTSGVGRLRDDLPGFLTLYSTSMVEEDKAEVFAHTLGSWSFVQARVAADPVIAAKVARMQEMVRQFDPQMDAAWWQRHAGDRH
jgi:hypothetical protein